MSYNATINFKTIKAEDVYPFFQQLKKCLKGKFDEIVEDNFLYTPTIRYEHIYNELGEFVKQEVDRKWAQTSVFTYRYFYLPEHNLLGVFSVPDAVQEIFDDSIYFQNSCDQDYDFDEWAKVPTFAKIAERWRNATDEEVRAKYAAERYGEWDEEENCDLDYYRRTFAYDEIWDMLKQYLFGEESVVYLAIFGHYESYEMSGFIKKCHLRYEEWRRIEG